MKILYKRQNAGCSKTSLKSSSFSHQYCKWLCYLSSLWLRTEYGVVFHFLCPPPDTVLYLTKMEIIIKIKNDVGSKGSRDGNIRVFNRILKKAVRKSRQKKKVDS